MRLHRLQCKLACLEELAVSPGHTSSFLATLQVQRRCTVDLSAEAISSAVAVDDIT